MYKWNKTYTNQTKQQQNNNNQKIYKIKIKLTTAKLTHIDILVM